LIFLRTDVGVHSETRKKLQLRPIPHRAAAAACEEFFS